MAATEDETDISDIRLVLHDILLQRMCKLRNQEMPDEYYVGKEYIDDTRRVKCIITAHAISPGLISDFDFWLNGAHIYVSQQGNVLIIRVHKHISQRLWDDMRLISRGDKFIIGYIRSYLPKINKTLLEKRYLDGNLLVRTFAIFELLDVFVTCQGWVVQVRWPISFPSFPPLSKRTSSANEIYIRDYIDACSSYFRNDYDDCIRRTITFSKSSWDLINISSPSSS